MPRTGSLSVKLAAAALFVLSVFVSGLFLFAGDALFGFGPEETRKMWLEVFRFLLTTALVGAVVFGYSLWREAGRRREGHESARHALMAEAIDIYNDVKRTRRELRRRALVVGETRMEFSYDDYVEMITSLNDSQLDLERHARLATAKPPFLVGHASEVAARFRKAEEYLNTIVDEYENRRLIVNCGAACKTDDALFQFLASSSSSANRGNAEREFFMPMKEVHEILAGAT